MNNRTLFGSALAIVAIVIAIVIVSKPHATARVPQNATSTTVAATSGAGPSYDTAPAPLPLNPGTRTVVTADASTTQSAPAPETSKEFATFVVGTSTYRASITASHTVIDSMRALADADASFTFDGEDHAGLGFFVRSINGKAAGNGYNWMLYINGKQAETGASQAKITSGDRVEWKYEK